MSRIVLSGLLEGTEIRLGKDMTVIVLKGRLIVKRRNNVLFEKSADEDWVLHRTPGRITLKPLIPPKGKGSIFLGWMCGAPRMAMKDSEAFYQEAKKKYKYPDMQTWEINGEGYMFFWSQKNKPSSTPYCVAYYISPEIKVPAILTMIPMMRNAGYSYKYISKLLGKKYGVTQMDFDKALEYLYE